MKGLNISKGAGKFVRGGKYIRTACVALAVSPADSDKLKRTQELYTKACNRIAKAVTADKGGVKRLWQRFNLHHETYRDIRTEIPNLGSQLVCSAIHRVSTGCKSWMENNPKKKKDDPWIFPEFTFNRASIQGERIKIPN